MTRDDIPAGAGDPHRRPDPDAAPGLELDGADAPSLAAARDTWRALREPLAPGPDLDARIRAAARRASAAAQPAGRVQPAGGVTAARVPAPSRGHVRRYAGWGLALAATLVAGIVLVLPPAPLTELPLEAPPHASPASSPDAAVVPEHAAAPVVPPPVAPPMHASMPATPLQESPPAATADGTANAGVEPVRQAPVTSAVPAAAVPAESVLAESVLSESVQAGAARAAPGQGATAPPAAPRAVAAPGAATRAEVEATFAAPPSAPSPSAARAAPAPSPSPSPASAPVAHRAADAVAASRDDAAIERELAELRVLLRARDPALPARLRAFVARHPAHPLARTDPALAEVFARDTARP